MSAFETSEQTDKIDEALAKAQRVMRPALKDAENPHFRSRFADYAAVVDACREPLTTHGISFMHAVGSDDEGRAIVTTRLAFAGQWIRCTAALKPAQPGPQGFGSVVSYLKRYQLQGLTGLPSDDDDGEQAEGRAPVKNPPRPAPAPRSPESSGSGSTMRVPPRGDGSATTPQADAAVGTVQGGELFDQFHAELSAILADGTKDALRDLSARIKAKENEIPSAQFRALRDYKAEIVKRKGWGPKPKSGTLSEEESAKFGIDERAVKIAELLEQIDGANHTRGLPAEQVIDKYPEIRDAYDRRWATLHADQTALPEKIA